MRPRILSFAIFAIISMFFAVGIATAASLTPSSMTLTGAQNSDANVPFTFVNTGATDVNQNSLVWSLVPQVQNGDLKGLTLKTSPAFTSINSGESKSGTAVINIPQTATGQVKAYLKVENSVTSLSLTLPITIDIVALDLFSTRELTIKQNGEIKVKNTGNVDLGAIAFSSSPNFVTFAPTSISSLGKDIESSAITVSLIPSADMNFGDNPITITAKSGNAQDSLTYTVRKSFCNAGSIGGNVSIKDVDISSSGDKDEDWKYLDEVTVDVEVENLNNNEDINDIVVELGLFNTAGDNVVNDLDFINSEEDSIDLGDLGDDDSDTVTFEFKVPADIDAGTYKLAVKAFSDDTGENNECDDTSNALDESDLFTRIDIDQEDDEGKFIAFDDIRLSPIEATCGEGVTMDLTAWNVGEDNEDQVKINLQNTELGIDENYEIRNDLDKGDKERVSFNFDIPDNAVDKIYSLLLNAEYDYRNGEYRQISDEDTKVSFKVIGCGNTPGGVTGNAASISASLDSDAEAGKEMVVTAVIKNNGNGAASFAVDATGYESWAKLEDISDRLVTLDAGESADVDLTFMVDADAAGSQSFTIEAQSGSDVSTRRVSVNIGESGGSNVDLGSLFAGSSLIWIVGIVNVVLIILIIVVAARVARK